jgi:excisionase family DNA binding protein
MPILNLSTHPTQYVTVAELAEYWGVSRQQIHKRIESGTLPAIKLGARLYRVRTESALEFERQARVDAGRPHTLRVLGSADALAKMERQRLMH